MFQAAHCPICRHWCSEVVHVSLASASHSSLQAGWALVDAPQYRSEPVYVIACLQLPFVPPCGARVGQWPDQVPGLPTVTRARASENHLERIIGRARTKLMHVADQIAHLVE